MKKGTQSSSGSRGHLEPATAGLELTSFLVLMKLNQSQSHKQRNEFTATSPTLKHVKWCKHKPCSYCCSVLMSFTDSTTHCCNKHHSDSGTELSSLVFELNPPTCTSFYLHVVLSSVSQCQTTSCFCVSSTLSFPDGKFDIFALFVRAKYF